ncbi:hypothetical protein ABZ499_32950 [Streptomyces sp. NPDC019990]|uniref:hypothetical protein n=1 Tax=Streptomyces sp. NPDC019990 TaxID=3154693 RepID=UPI0033D47AC2
MATTDSPPTSGYQPSARLRECEARWRASVEWKPVDGEPEPDNRIPSVAEARDALEAGIQQELTEDVYLSLPTLSQHVPWTAENLRLLMVKRGGYPPRRRHRKSEGDPPVYQPSERLRDLLAAYHLSLDEEKKARTALEKCIADEMTAHPGVTDAEMSEHTPWARDQVRLIAAKYGVPGTRKRASEHKLQRTPSGKPKSVVVPYDWYARQPGADQRIIKEAEAAQE